MLVFPYYLIIYVIKVRYFLFFILELTHYKCGEVGSNPCLCINYAMSLPTELNSRGLKVRYFLVHKNVYYFRPKLFIYYRSLILSFCYYDYYFLLFFLLKSEYQFNQKKSHSN